MESSNDRVSPRALEGTPQNAENPRNSKVAWRDLAWFLLALLVLPLHRELWIAAGILIVVGIAFRARYYRGEALLFGVGTVFGLVFELGGDAIYKLQYWSQGSLFGIPAWLPFFWGLGFVFIRRFGNALIGY